MLRLHLNDKQFNCLLGCDLYQRFDGYRTNCVPMVVSICLHFALHQYYYYADVSEGIAFLKCLSGAFCRVCVWDQVNSLSYLSYNIRAVCVRLIHFCFDDCENKCTFIIIIESEVWSMCHFLGFGHETMVCTVCISIFYDSYIRSSIRITNIAKCMESRFLIMKLDSIYFVIFSIIIILQFPKSYVQ